MRDELARVGNPYTGLKVFGTVAVLRELLHICHTGWMSRKHRGNYVVYELSMYMQGGYAR